MSNRSAPVAVAALAVALGTFVGVSYEASDGVVVGALLAVLGGLSLVGARLVARHRPALGSLRRQFAIAAAVVVGQIVVVLIGGALLMFVSPHDATLAAVLVVFAGVVGLLAARTLAEGALADVAALRATLVAVGEGERAPAPTPGGADELAELTAAANAAIVRLAETEQSRADLIAAVSHDLRTPITSMRLLAEAIDDNVVDAETRERYARAMTTHIRALSALIDDLFELSRLEADALTWSVEQVRLDELVGETVDAMQGDARDKGVRVAVALGGATTVRGNPEKLQRVLFNLIQNAIRHTPQDGSITVSARAAGDAVEVEVADTGPGIAEADRARVFEPFFRGGTNAARTSAGAGLGLAISRAIVEAHGGRIWLEGARAGTRICFTVPHGTP